jgi:FixJ family two-component response regulator
MRTIVMEDIVPGDRSMCAVFQILSVAQSRTARGTMLRVSSPLVNSQEGELPGRVHVVDDDASFRTAVERRLKNAGYEVATYPSAQQLLDDLPNESTHGCILLDVRMPGLSGPDLQARLMDLGSTLPIVFLTGHADTRTTVQTIKACAQDFLTKPVSSDQLLGAIERAIAFHLARLDQRGELDRLRNLLGLLTPRERQVFDLVVRGKINKQIATQLGTTVRTVKAHRHRVMEKMKVQSLAELVSIAERLGVLRAPEAAK